MKRIVRLTESDLTRIVRRVIRESKGMINEGNGANAAVKLHTALSGSFWDDDESGALAAIKTIKTCQELQECMTKIKALTGKTLPAYIDSEMSAADSEYDGITAHISNLSSNCGDRQSFNDGYNSWNNILKWAGGRAGTISY
jgi:hypothetical protein